MSFATAYSALTLQRNFMAFKSGPVFVTTTGNYFNTSNFYRKILRPLVDRVNELVPIASQAPTKKGETAPAGIVAPLPRIKFHMLRHMHASTLLANGRNIREVAERLGHANPELTLRVYAHLMPGMGKETAAVLDKLFGT
jgi:integrase